MYLYLCIRAFKVLFDVHGDLASYDRLSFNGLGLVSMLSSIYLSFAKIHLAASLACFSSSSLLRGLDRTGTPNPLYTPSLASIRSFQALSLGVGSMSIPAQACDRTQPYTVIVVSSGDLRQSISVPTVDVSSRVLVSNEPLACAGV